MTTATSSAASTGPNVEAVTTTPIKHLVVIYQENVSFDHYFGTYPNVANPADDPACHTAGDAPSVSGLTRHLLEKNPNAANPRRLDRSQAITCDMDHSYTAVQRAADAGLMDKSVKFTSVGWYDHKIPPIVSQSNDAADGLTSAGHCGTAASGSYEDRCGYGPR